MNKRIFWLSVLVTVALLLSGCQNRPTAEEIVAKMQEVEAGIEDAHAVVEVDVQAQDMDESAVVELWEKRPAKFRVEVLEVSREEFAGAVSVTDGQQVWMYLPEENTVRVGELADSEELSNPAELIQRTEGLIQHLLDVSDVKLVGEETVAGVDTYKLEFVPKEDAETPLPVDVQGTLWVEKERWIMLQAHVVGEAVGEGWVRVRSFEFNTGLSDERFRFEIPEGVDVIETEVEEPQSLTLDEARAQAEFALLVPTYVPQGATLIDVFYAEGGIVLSYDHAAVSFTIVQRPSGERLPLPGGEEVTVRGQAAILIANEGLGKSLLTWTEDGVDVTIAGQIGQEDILQVAESLQ